MARATKTVKAAKTQVAAKAIKAKAKAAPQVKAKAAPAKATAKAKARVEDAKPAKPAAKPAVAAKGKQAPKTAAALKPVAAAPAPARFGFEAMPMVRDAAGLTPLLRQQLVWDARLSGNRTTTPDRIPTTYFAPGVIRWRVTENKKALLDIVHNTAFFAGTDEPAGLERRAGLWVATGRATTRGLTLDLPGTAWDLNRDWPGRRLPLPPEPKRGAKFKPEALPDGEPYPPGTAFI